MWLRDGAAFFFGPIFIHPEETEHEPTKMFYKREVFLSGLEETCPMTCILGMGTDKLIHCNKILVSYVCYPSRTNQTVGVQAVIKKFCQPFFSNAHGAFGIINMLGNLSFHKDTENTIKTYFLRKSAVILWYKTSHLRTLNA